MSDREGAFASVRQTPGRLVAVASHCICTTKSKDVAARRQSVLVFRKTRLKRDHQRLLR
jgi:hypothetical protein